MARTPSITKFTNSLKDFLINAMANKINDVKALGQRYNNMKVFMDPTMIDEPHFFVSLGISEVCFSIKSGNKLDGGLGMEDIYVKRWAERHNIHTELEKYYKDLKEALRKEAMMTEEERRDAKVASVKDVIRRGQRDDEDLKVDMTGTGIDKQKRVAAEERNKKRLLYFKKNLAKKESSNPDKENDEK